MNASEMLNNTDPYAQDEKPIQLYLARFENETATLTSSTHGERKIALYGEMVIVSSGLEEGEPIVEALRRISLWTDSVEELGGVLSLAGPGNKLTLKPGPKGELVPFDMRLYYPLLSQLDPACREGDAVYPQLETLRGRLTWELESIIEKRAFTMLVKFTVPETPKPPLGAVTQFTFEIAHLTFERMELGAANETPRHHSLTQCSAPAPSVTGIHEYFNLKLRFVNLSATRTASDLEGQPSQPGIVQELVNRACDVWWAKGGIKIVPDNVSIVTDTLPWPDGKVTSGRETDPSLSSIQKANDAVEVYLVDQLTDEPGGGITHNCGTDAAYVILEIGKAEHNKYLLAHELGHVLGLMHPSGGPCPGYRNGSTCSVMVPDKPNSSRNTSDNLKVVDDPANPLPKPTGQVLRSRNQQGGWKPDDDYDHYIRDFSYDAGVEPSRPEPPATYWWTHSDVWNSDKPRWQIDPTKYDGGITDIFDENDNFPNHSEPTYSGPNYMYVRLHSCRPFNQSVSVHLFLAVPGSASETLTRLPVTGLGATNPLIFSSSDFPLDGTPVTKPVQWTVPSDSSRWPMGYPANCCVFAVAQSANEPTPDIDTIINNFASKHFYDLFSRLKTDNDVAQRNLHFQGTPPPGPMPLLSTLAWVQIDNPFERAASARLEIDATQALGLASLAIQVDDGPFTEIKLGEQSPVAITDALRPDEHRILRFRAALPPNTSEGKGFPINLRFVVDDQLVSGYTHLLRVVPLSEAVLQVLDCLYGALRAVGVGCKSNQAQDLAEKAKEIVLRERLVTQQPLGCAGLLWMILRRRNEWRSEVGGLSKDVAALAQSLESRDGEPECVMVRKQLYKLSEQLLAPQDTPDAVFIEGIRDLADRIQEPAGRLARRAQSR